MNVAYFLKPKGEVGYIYDDCTLRQGLERLKRSGYTALPVVTRENRYVGTVSEGDFLWQLISMDQGDTLSVKSVWMHRAEEVVVRDVLRFDRHPPVRITADEDMLVTCAMNQQFIPVVDDLGSFIGIVTRQDILRYFYERDINAVRKSEYA